MGSSFAETSCPMRTLQRSSFSTAFEHCTRAIATSESSLHLTSAIRSQRSKGLWSRSCHLRKIRPPNRIYVPDLHSDGGRHRSGDGPCHVHRQWQEATRQVGLEVWPKELPAAARTCIKPSGQLTICEIYESDN